VAVFGALFDMRSFKNRSGGRKFMMSKKRLEYWRMESMCSFVHVEFTIRKDAPRRDIA
jgi:hypothetical protein